MKKPPRVVAKSAQSPAPAVRPSARIDPIRLRALRARPELMVRPMTKPVGAPDRLTLGTQFVVGEDGAAAAWLEFAVPVAGHCVFEARWTGDIAGCRLTVRDPAGNELHAPGASPLRLELDVASALAGRAGTWRVTVAPNAKSGTARGELVATLPKPAAAPAPPSGSGSAACAIQRTLLENGNVQLTYADGTVATYYASGGYSTQSPDGIATQAMHVNVPHPVPPSLPDDPEISAWLDGTNGDLLDQIRALVQDDAAVDRYVSGEAAVAPTVYEQIRKRIGVLGQLQAAR